MNPRTKAELSEVLQKYENYIPKNIETEWIDSVERLLTLKEMNYQIHHMIIPKPKNIDAILAKNKNFINEILEDQLENKRDSVKFILKNQLKVENYKDKTFTVIELISTILKLADGHPNELQISTQINDLLQEVLLAKMIEEKTLCMGIVQHHPTQISEKKLNQLSMNLNNDLDKIVNNTMGSPTPISTVVSPTVKPANTHTAISKSLKKNKQDSPRSEIPPRPASPSPDRPPLPNSTSPANPPYLGQPEPLTPRLGNPKTTPFRNPEDTGPKDANNRRGSGRR